MCPSCECLRVQRVPPVAQSRWRRASCRVCRVPVTFRFCSCRSRCVFLSSLLRVFLSSSSRPLVPPCRAADRKAAAFQCDAPASGHGRLGVFPPFASCPPLLLQRRRGVPRPVNSHEQRAGTRSSRHTQAWTAATRRAQSGDSLGTHATTHQAWWTIVAVGLSSEARQSAAGRAGAIAPTMLMTWRDARTPPEPCLRSLICGRAISDGTHCGRQSTRTARENKRSEADTVRMRCRSDARRG